MKHITVILACILLASPASAGRIDQDFARADADNDGYLTITEIAAVQEQSLDQQNDDTLKLLDADGNGTVSKAEYKAFYSKVAANQDGKEPDLDKNFNTLDTDNDGKLTKQELQSFRTNTLDSTNQMAIELMDTDKDGKISRREYDDFAKSVEALFEGM